jgi:protein-L-isoaspartate(D-aspartate) O-methyltransferase
MDETLSFEYERLRMVENQLVSRGINDQRVLNAMRNVPRHEFITPEYCYAAYDDCPLPISNGQTISQPYIVALMSELLELKGDEIVLEVGTGSGYQAAILGELARQVHTIERHARLSQDAGHMLARLGYENIQVHLGDGSKGLPEYAPYDAIIVTAAAPEAPQVLLDQLAERGRLVIPVGRRFDQYLQRWRRSGDQFKHENLLPVVFVPLIGKEGWHDQS